MKESEKIKKILGFCLKTKKAVEQVVDGDTNSNWFAWNGHQILRKETGGIGNPRKNRDHPDHSITKIGLESHGAWGELQSLRLQWKTNR